MLLKLVHASRDTLAQTELKISIPVSEFVADLDFPGHLLLFLQGDIPSME
jgi:hypothetical protein